LKELTEVGDITQEQFEDQFASMRSSPGMYYCTVIVDQNKNEIVGAATLLMEKFIRQCAMRARIEDVVVSPNYRGKQLGKCIVDLLVKLGQALGAYKISLDCKDQMIPFYESLGFKQDWQFKFFEFTLPKSSTVNISMLKINLFQVVRNVKIDHDSF